jgi:metal-responsive CopG/Arc/MetJ family transcriptional regulator
MASAPTATTQQITVSLPADVLRAIDALAAEKKLTRSEIMTGAARRFLFSEQRWDRLQARGMDLARAAGLKTEDDVEDFLDALPE